MNTNENEKVNEFLRLWAKPIMEFAFDKFTINQERGFVTVVAKNCPENTVFKEGSFYYTTEEENNKLCLSLPHKSQEDIKLEKDLREYNPSSEAVVLVWYKTFFKEVRMTNTASW